MRHLRATGLLVLLSILAGCCGAWSRGKDAYNTGMLASSPTERAEAFATARTELNSALDNCTLEPRHECQVRLLLTEIAIRDSRWNDAIVQLERAGALEEQSTLPEQERAFYHIVRGEALAVRAVERFNERVEEETEESLQARLDQIDQLLSGAVMEYQAASLAARTLGLGSFTRLRQAQLAISSARLLEIGSAETRVNRYNAALGILTQAREELNRTTFRPDLKKRADRLRADIEKEIRALEVTLRSGS
jgi:hypothetical protein